MFNLLDAFVRVTLDDQASSKIGTVAKGLGNTLKTAAKVGAAAVTAAGAAVVKLTKDAIEQYAEYEQLVGGVETLFGDSADIVKGYADNAYKTAGMSANDYMETVTSFSAALIQGLDGDTEMAAKVANTAITDMSDNANKMGTDMESIQNAYMGFAKGNYTMLDNLKLGYGGTQSEMIRLINDSGVLEKQITSLDGITFDQMIAAIHVVQDNLGITGTTATEASTTIQGSISTMQGAWSNLLVGLADDNADFDTLINNFADSVITVGENLIPRIETTLGGIGQLINAFAEKILPLIIDAIVQNLPTIIEAGANIIIQLMVGLTKALPQLISQIPVIVREIASAIKENWPAIKEAGSNLIQGLWEGIKSMANWLWNQVMAFFGDLIDGIKEFLGIHSPSKVFAGIGEYMAEGLGEGWDDEYSDIKKDINSGLDFTTTMTGNSTSGNSTSSENENMINIVVQSVLDGKVIGETAYKYSKNKARLVGA